MRYVYIKYGDAVDQVRRLAAGARSGGGGTEAFIESFLRAHATDEVLVLCRSIRRQVFKTNGLKAESIPAAGRFIGGVIGRAWSALHIGFKVLMMRPDRIVCGCTGELLWVSTVISIALRIPLVHSRHGQSKNRVGLSRAISGLDRLCVRTCVGVVCHGPYLLQQVRSLGIPASRSFEFDVDLTEFVAVSARSVAPVQMKEFGSRFRFLLLYAGRIQTGKGVLDLLEAFAGLPATIADEVGLVYAGAGVDMKRLRRRVSELGVDDKVLLLGRVPHDELPGTFCFATAVVAPTRPELGEGRCMVALEALALGVPVVAPDLGAFPYVVRQEVNGLLFEPGNVCDLRRSIARLVTDQDFVSGLTRGAEAASRDLPAVRRTFSEAVDLAFGAG